MMGPWDLELIDRSDGVSPLSTRPGSWPSTTLLIVASVGRPCAVRAWTPRTGMSHCLDMCRKIAPGISDALMDCLDGSLLHTDEGSSAMRAKLRRPYRCAGLSTLT